MVKRVLVTTALEDTWPKDGSSILFLGEWCKLYERKHVWEKLDYEVVPYHWDDRQKLYNDYNNLLVVYEDALRALADKLNQIHGESRSLRYWRILIGPWLGYFIQMLFDRWFMLDAIFRKHDVAGVSVFYREPHEAVPNDMSDFTQRFTDDDWNEAIYSDLICLFPSQELKVNQVNKKRNSSQSELNQRIKDSQNFNISSVLKKATKRILRYLGKITLGKTDYFFISSYMPRKVEFLMQLRLNRFPKFFFSSGIEKIEPQFEARQWNLDLRSSNSVLPRFEEILVDMIPRHIPVAYLEGYDNLVDTGETLGWPNRPKAIFTSNAYSADDVFKAWTAEKIENGSKLVIGQHGGHFGMTPFAFHEEHQIEIADRWISWGWSDPSRIQIKPVGNFKDAGKSKIKSKKNGKALLVQMTMPRYSYCLYALPVSATQWSSYFKDQERFVAGLRDEGRRNLLVRLNHNDYGFGQVSRWRDSFQDIQLDDGRRPMRDMLTKARIYISTYNATTYLESLALNFPTIIFWNSNHWELKSDVAPYFNLLESVGIFHKTPESAAQKMNEIWDDVDRWWLSSETQKARRIFCEKYSKSIKHPVKELASIITEA